jgi:hypothetical protein
MTKKIEREIEQLEAEWHPRHPKFHRASPGEMGDLAEEAHKVRERLAELKAKLPNGHPHKRRRF